MPKKDEKVKCPMCDGLGWVEIMDKKEEEMFERKIRLDILNRQIEEARMEG